MEAETITEFCKIPISKIVVNKLNPRKDMGDLEGLRKSIIQDVLIQPLVVRQYKGNGKYELIAGERRYTAIMDAITSEELPKLYEIPVVVKDATDEETKRMMIVENLMRKDLNDYEETKAFADYLKDNDDKSAVLELADKTGINHQYIMRRVRVMKLDFAGKIPDEILVVANSEEQVLNYVPSSFNDEENGEDDNFAPEEFED